MVGERVREGHWRFRKELGKSNSGWIKSKVRPRVVEERLREGHWWLGKELRKATGGLGKS